VSGRERPARPGRPRRPRYLGGVAVPVPVRPLPQVQGHWEHPARPPPPGLPQVQRPAARPAPRLANRSPARVQDPRRAARSGPLSPGGQPWGYLTALTLRVVLIIVAAALLGPAVAAAVAALLHLLLIVAVVLAAVTAAGGLALVAFRVSHRGQETATGSPPHRSNRLRCARSRSARSSSCVRSICTCTASPPKTSPPSSTAGTDRSLMSPASISTAAPHSVVAHVARDLGGDECQRGCAKFSRRVVVSIVDGED